MVDQAVILAGGFGTRLRSVVRDVPKPLAPVADRPFLEWILNRLESQGVRRVVLATGYMADAVERALGDRFGEISIAYSVEGVPLGTGGAIALAARRIENLESGLHVINGDTYLEYSLDAMQTRVSEGTSLCMALAHVEDVARYGAVDVRGDRVERFREKGESGAGLINAGCYHLSGALLRSLEVEPFSFEEFVLTREARAGRVRAVAQTRNFIDIGVPEDYRRAQSFFENTR